MYVLRDIKAQEIAALSADIASAGFAAASMEAAATDIVRRLYDQLRDAAGRRATLLVRLYKTHPYERLDAELQAFVRQLAGTGEVDLRPQTRCLTLLATVGDEPAWCSRHTSEQHKALPLLSVEMVRRLPMVARLVSQLGLPIGAVVEADPGLLLPVAEQPLGIFHVPEVRGSPYIPAQKSFVEPFGVRSALGFGTLLPDAELVAVVLFTRVPVSRSTAERFPPLAHAVGQALVRFGDGPVFAADAAS